MRFMMMMICGHKLCGSIIIVNIFNNIYWYFYLAFTDEELSFVYHPCQS